MPFGRKEESYSVEVDDQGRKYLKPKDDETRKMILKKMGKQQKKEKSPEQLDREHIKAMEKAYRSREKAKKEKEKARKKKQWAKVKKGVRETQKTSRETMNLSMFGKPSKSSRKGKVRAKKYTIIDGVAYPIHQKKKVKKKKDDISFNWSDMNMDMKIDTKKEFKMPKWKDMFR